MLKNKNRFSDLRNDWLAGGDVARSTQTSYTVRVERIPRAFRSPAILQKFFSTLFPGQVRRRTPKLCAPVFALKKKKKKSSAPFCPIAVPIGFDWLEPWSSAPPCLIAEGNRLALGYSLVQARRSQT